MLFRKLIYASLMLSLLTVNVAFAVEPLGIAETYYVPIPEQQVYDNLEALNPIKDPNNPNLPLPNNKVTSTTIESAISIAVSTGGTIIYFDHAEDGFDADILNPLLPTTSRIFGDGVTGNGDACVLIGASCAGVDKISAGDVLVFRNQVDTSIAPVGPPYQFTGGDKFASTQPLQVTRIAWATIPGTVLAGAIEVFPTSSWGTVFETPVGEFIPSDGMFAQVAVSFMAMEDDTFIALDTGTNTCLPADITIIPCTTPGSQPDGIPDLVFALLNEGESALTPIDQPFQIGSGAFSTKPIQAHAISGDPTAVWESRWYVVLSKDEWGKEYFFPVSTRHSETFDPTDVFVYNPISTGGSITVTCQALINCSKIHGGGMDPVNEATIAAGDFARFRIPNNSGARFTTGELGAPFYAVSTIDSNPDLAVFPIGAWIDPDLQNMAFDWGYAGVPTKKLSTQALVGFAPSIDPTQCNGPSDVPSGSPFICDEPEDSDSNPLGMGSPIWVMSTKLPGEGDTLVYVDHDGDPLTSRISTNDPAGNGYDKVFTIAPLARIKIFDELDGDGTGTMVYTLNGTRIAVAWGQDPSSSRSFNPYFDAGTYIPALPQFSMAKAVDKMLARPGDVLTYTVNATNTSRALIDDLIMVDTLPLPEGVVTYNANTTEQDLDPVTPNPPGDGGVFPLLAGIELGELASGATTTVTFQVTIDPDILTNDDPGDNCPDPQTAVINNATVSSDNHSFDDDALTCVEFIPGIDIEKLTEGYQADLPNDSDVPVIKAGDQVEWTYRVKNTGELPLINIVVFDDIIGLVTTCPKSALAVDESMDCIVKGNAENVSKIDNSVPGTCDKITKTPLYENKGTATGFTAENVEVNDADLSHYCNPLVPSITIEKSTNTVDADNPNAGDAPQIAIGGDVNWAYLVTNTGDLRLDPVAVVDDQGVAVSCPKTALDPGDFMTCTASGLAVDVSDTTFTTVSGTCGIIPNTPLYANKGTATGTPVVGDPVKDTDPSHYCNDIPEGGEGCTPGYWKQSQHFGSWTSPYRPVDPETQFSAVFENAFPGKTLLEVLKQGGGGLKALGRHTVAALLNTASDGVAYDLSTAAVIKGFNDEYPGRKKDYNELKDTYAGFNELGCPLNRAEWSEPE